MTTATMKIVAVMGVKKETPGKVVFEEEELSAHLDEIGIPLNIYVPKPSVKTLLGGATRVRLTIEPWKEP